MSGKWQESASKHITVLETPPECFEHFDRWLQAGHFHLCPPTAPSKLNLHELIDIYLMGNYLQSTPFCNATLRSMIAYRFETDTIPDADDVVFIWESTSHLQSSPLREVVMELWFSLGMARASELLQQDEGLLRDVCGGRYGEVDGV